MFWSPLDLGEGSLVDDDLVVNTSAGASGRAYLYYNPEGQDIVSGGFEIDFFWDSPGIVGFTDAEVLNYDITAAGVPFEQRWAFTANPFVNENTVVAFNASDNGFGLRTALSEAANGPLLDTGSQGDFFQLGYIDWIALDAGEVSLEISDSLFASDGTEFFPTFRGFSIVVPEPGSAAGLLLLTSGGLAVGRHRRL